MTTGSRMVAMADAADMMQAGQQIGLEFFGKVSLLNAWNAGMRQFSGVMAADTFLQWSAKSTLLKPAQRKVAARARLDEGLMRRVKQQFDEFGETVDGLRIANTDSWTDREAAELFEASVRSEVNHMIIQPGIGDKPLTASTEVGKLAFQFQSFIISAQNRMLVNGLQRHDIAFVSGIIGSVFMGMFVAFIKNEVRGAEQPSTPQEWIAEGVDRSGVLGLLSYPFNWSRMAFGDTPSRFASRSIAGTFLGPTPGQMTRAVKIGTDAAQGDFDEENFAWLMPFQNLWHLRQIFEQVNQ